MELFGFLGALLAIPVAGVLKVIGRDVYDVLPRPPQARTDHRDDEIPVSQPRPLEPGEPQHSDVPATAHR